MATYLELDQDANTTLTEGCFDADDVVRRFYGYFDEAKAIVNH